MLQNPNSNMFKIYEVLIIRSIALIMEISNNPSSSAVSRKQMILSHVWLKFHQFAPVC